MDPVKLGQSSSRLVEAIQALIADHASVDVRVRCKDHQPSDGLGAHRLILAAASPNYLKHLMLSVATEDDLICLHLPDYTSGEIGPIMSLLYYGETWISESYAQIGQKILDELKIAVQIESYAENLPITLDHPRLRIKKEPMEESSEEQCKVEQQSTVTSDTTTNTVDLAKVKRELTESNLNLRNIKTEPPDSDDNLCESLITTPGEPSNDPLRATVECNEPGCSYSTSSLSSLQSHRLIHGRKNARLTQSRTCPACRTMLDTPKETREHALESHSEIVENIVSCILDEKCTWKGAFGDDNLTSDFFKHVQTNHTCEDQIKEEPTQWLLCDHPGCEYQTSKGYNLTQHLRHHNDERQHQCPVCEKSFRASSHLRDHLKAVHTKERNFECPKCPRSFSRSWALQSHVQANHGKAKNYRCEKCGRNFLTNQALAGHMTSGHHPNQVQTQITKENKKNIQKVCEKCGGILMKNHQCQIDNNTTSSQQNNKICPICQKSMEPKAMRHHLQYHRRKEVSHHVCQFCNKSFTTQVSLKRHVLIHENAKPYSCPVCEKTFRQKVALNAHQRTHSGVRFSCQHCNRKFITKSLLTQHQKSCQNVE